MSFISVYKCASKLYTGPLEIEHILLVSFEEFVKVQHL